MITRDCRREESRIWISVGSFLSPRLIFFTSAVFFPSRLLRPLPFLHLYPLFIGFSLPSLFCTPVNSIIHLSLFFSSSPDHLRLYSVFVPRSRVQSLDTFTWPCSSCRRKGPCCQLVFVESVVTRPQSPLRNSPRSSLYNNLILEDHTVRQGFPAFV